MLEKGGSQPVSSSSRLDLAFSLSSSSFRSSLVFLRRPQRLGLSSSSVIWKCSQSSSWRAVDGEGADLLPRSLSTSYGCIDVYPCQGLQRNSSIFISRDIRSRSSYPGSKRPSERVENAQGSVTFHVSKSISENTRQSVYHGESKRRWLLQFCNCGRDLFAGPLLRGKKLRVKWDLHFFIVSSLFFFIKYQCGYSSFHWTRFHSCMHRDDSP